MGNDEHSQFIAALFGAEKVGQQGGQQQEGQPAPEAPGQEQQAAGQEAPAPPAAPGPEVEGTPPEPPATDADRRQEDTAAIEEVVAAVTLPENLPGWQAAAAQAHGLPPALAPRLQGSTEAGVYVDASRLAASLGTGPGAAEKALLQRNRGKDADFIRSIHPEPRDSGNEGTT